MNIETPEPGIYRNVPFATYIAWDAINNSRLSRMAMSPAHYQCDTAWESTKPLQIGQLVHCGRLEPMAIAQRYVVCPDYHLDGDNKTTGGESTQSKATKYVKSKVSEFTATNAEKEIVPREYYDEVCAIVSSLCQHDDANRLFNDGSDNELSILWRDPETDLLCKARIDKLAKSYGALVDLKTTADIIDFSRSIGRYSYHRQLAFYRWGYSVLTGELLEPWIVAVENKPPYCCHAAPFDDDAIESGESQFRRLLDKLAECRESGVWPGPQFPARWSVPVWAMDSEPLTLTIGGQAVEL